MNVYDFDGTIYYANSVTQFVGFCIKRHPKLLVTFLPKTLKVAIRYLRGKTGYARLNAAACRITAYLKDPQKDIDAFWAKHAKDISEWYLKQKRSDDLIISASPEYLIRPIAEKLGVNCIATVVDLETGVLIGNVRMAKEKAKYIIEQDMPMMDGFYSDSLSDTPIALLAEKAYLVKDKATRPEPWPHMTPEIIKKVHRKIHVDF